MIYTTIDTLTHAFRLDYVEKVHMNVVAGYNDMVIGYSSRAKSIIIKFYSKQVT